MKVFITGGTGNDTINAGIDDDSVFFLEGGGFRLTLLEDDADHHVPVFQLTTSKL